MSTQYDRALSDMSDRLLTTREAARLLRVSEASIRRWADSGLLSASRVGRRRVRRFHEADLRLVLARDARPTTGPATALPRGIALLEMTIPVGSHLLTLYGSDAGRGRLELPFLRDGLRNGQTCYLLAPDAVRDEYLDALRGEGVDVEAALRSRLLVVLPLTRGSPAEEVGVFERAFTAGTRARPGPLRFVGDTLGGLAIVESAAALLVLEQGLTGLSKRFPIVMLCSYDVRAHPGETILDALKLHSDTFAHPVGYFLS